MDWNYLYNTFWLSLKGVPTTLIITCLSLLIGTPVALLFAFAKIHPKKFLTHFVNGYISLIRGIPMVLQILIIYSLFPSLLNSLVKKLQIPVDIFSINPIYYAIFVFSLTAIASLTEIYRSAILTVDSGQLEAALSIGLSKRNAYLKIVFPQAMKAALPNLCNLFIQIVKGTSLAFIMTVKDITAVAKIEAAYGYHYIESYLDVFLIYILLCSIIQIIFTILEYLSSNPKVIRKEAFA